METVNQFVDVVIAENHDLESCCWLFMLVPNAHATWAATKPKGSSCCAIFTRKKRTNTTIIKRHVDRLHCYRVHRHVADINIYGSLCKDHRDVIEEMKKRTGPYGMKKATNANVSRKRMDFLALTAS